MFKFKKLGFLKRHDLGPVSGWHTHIMAPTVRQKPDGVFEVFCGGWGQNKISKIFKFELIVTNQIKYREDSATLALDIGMKGCFDDNGVFPAHLSTIGMNEVLFYTGFKLAPNSINHVSFGGVCNLLSDGTISRISDTPILGKSKEGLLVRAGQSSLSHEAIAYTVYSAGNASQWVGGKNRPVYDVYMQIGVDALRPLPEGEKLISRDPALEHGLGRPQLVQINSELFIFYTRRTLNMKYTFGYAHFCKQTKSAKKFVPNLEEVERSHGFDDEMVYFPSIIKCNASSRYLLFYSGNNFGEKGMGILEIIDV